MPKAAGIGLVLEEPIVRIFLWRRHGKSRTRHRTHRAETLAENFISLWLATPRASLARIRQAIATKQLRHGLTGADVQFSGTATSTSTPVGRRSLGRLRPAGALEAEKSTLVGRETPTHHALRGSAETPKGRPRPPP